MRVEKCLSVLLLCGLGCVSEVPNTEKEPVVVDPNGESPQEEPSEDPEEPVEEPVEEPAEEPQEERFEPVSGSWNKVNEYLPLDDCDMAEWVSDGPGGTIQLNVLGDDMLEIQHGHGNEDCTFTEAGFNCNQRWKHDTTPQEDYGLDATIILNLKATGSFYGDAAMEMETEIDVDCEGPACWLVSLSTASFPCEMTVILEAEAQ